MCTFDIRTSSFIGISYTHRYTHTHIYIYACTHAHIYMVSNLNICIEIIYIYVYMYMGLYWVLHLEKIYYKDLDHEIMAAGDKSNLHGWPEGLETHKETTLHFKSHLLENLLSGNFSLFILPGPSLNLKRFTHIVEGICFTLLSKY